MIVGGDSDVELHAIDALRRVAPGHLAGGTVGDVPFDVRRRRAHRMQHRGGHLQRVRHAILMKSDALTQCADPLEGRGVCQSGGAVLDCEKRCDDAGVSVLRLLDLGEGHHHAAPEFPCARCIGVAVVVAVSDRVSAGRLAANLDGWRGPVVIEIAAEVRLLAFVETQRRPGKPGELAVSDLQGCDLAGRQTGVLAHESAVVKADVLARTGGHGT